MAAPCAASRFLPFVVVAILLASACSSAPDRDLTESAATTDAGTDLPLSTEEGASR